MHTPLEAESESIVGSLEAQDRILDKPAQSTQCLPPVHIEMSHAQQVALSRDLELICCDFSQEKMPYQLAEHSAEVIKHHLTPENLSHIKKFEETGASPYVLVRNLVTTNNLPPTPADDVAPEERGWRLQAAALLGTLRLCGFNAASFLDEMEGRLYHMVMPARNSQKSFLRSTKPLNLHTEVVNGYFPDEDPKYGAPLSPGGFGLVCLRNPDSIPTTILPIKTILDKLEDETLTELMQKNFTLRSQSSFDREIIINNMPVIKRMSNDLLGMRYSHSKLSGQSTAANSALLKLKSIISESPDITPLTLQTGDAVILNNRICLHGRSKVSGTQRFDGLDRWLVRIYGYKDQSMNKIKFDSSRKYAMIVDKRGEL